MALPPTIIMSRDMARQAAAEKRGRDSYAKWLEREEAAKKRREEMRK